MPHHAAPPFVEYVGINAVPDEDGAVVAEVELVQHLLNRSGAAHGGLIATLLDTTPGWHMLRVPLKCFRDRGATVDKVSSPFSLEAASPFTVSISDIRLATDPAGAVCPPAGET